jgi:hypothetical protein
MMSWINLLIVSKSKAENFLKYMNFLFLSWKNFIAKRFDIKNTVSLSITIIYESKGLIKLEP